MNRLRISVTKRVGPGLLVLSFMCGLAIVACGPADKSGGPGDGIGEPCSGDLKRCRGQSHQQCVSGAWAELEECAAENVCTANTGCSECDPTKSRVCVGADVYACSGGNLGELVESCPLDGCSSGSCGGSNGCGSGTELIYVVDAEYRLLSFDPSEDRHTFSLVGNLDCPTAHGAWPGFDGGLGSPATPFSMSVDRQGVAWVVYSSGEIFHVSTRNAQCTASSYPRGQGGYELFGMGFVADGDGFATEKLAIAGGSASGIATSSAELGMIEPGSMSLSPVGQMSGGGEYSPELSGTGRGELYAYYPGSFSTYIAEIDVATGAERPGRNFALPPVVGDYVSAWAFAHWGGRFYVFVTTDNLEGTATNSQVFRLDPATGDTASLLANLPYTIVGAGVSTCAPVSID